MHFIFCFFFHFVIYSTRVFYSSNYNVIVMFKISFTFCFVYVYVCVCFMFNKLRQFIDHFWPPLFFWFHSFLCLVSFKICIFFCFVVSFFFIQLSFLNRFKCYLLQLNNTMASHLFLKFHLQFYQFNGKTNVFLVLHENIFLLDCIEIFYDFWIFLWGILLLQRFAIQTFTYMFIFSLFAI